MARRPSGLVMAKKHRPGQVGTPRYVRKVSGEVVRLTAKRWHVLEIMARLEGWTRVTELGVFTAPTTLHLLNTLPNIRVTAVDFYQVPQGDFKQDGYTHYGAPDMEELYQSVCRSLKPFETRVRLLRMTTVEAANHVENKTQDAVFIDADHRTPNVIADIAAWRPKVRIGGWMMGHDWHWESVRTAVYSWAKAPLVLPDNVWAVRL